MRIVVTGSKGFIGSVFALRALEYGHEVIALDDESRGENAIEASAVLYRRHDCMGGIREGLRDTDGRPITHVDAVVHLAAATGSLERPLDELLAYNLHMMSRVYQDAVALRAGAFVWPTTSLALGVPDSPYVISKERALTWLRTSDSQAQISIPVRFFNVAGAYKGFTERRKNEVHIVPAMLEAHRRGEHFVINGDTYDTSDGTPSRDFVNVLDVVEYLLALISDKLSHRPLRATPHAVDGAIWLGTGVATTVADVLTIFRQYVGPIRSKVGPIRPFDCGGLTVDPGQADQFSRARKSLVPPWVSIRDELMALSS